MDISLTERVKVLETDLKEKELWQPLLRQAHNLHHEAQKLVRDSMEVVLKSTSIKEPYNLKEISKLISTEIDRLGRERNKESEHSR